MARHTQPSLRRALGLRLRDLRIHAGISSQEKLAMRAGVHRTYVGRLERGETGVTVDMLAAIVAAAGSTLADFFAPFSHPVRPATPRKRRPHSQP